MADVPLGQAHTPTLYVTDANGSPATTGVSGTMTLTYEPTGVQVGSGALAHQGGGLWGVEFPGSAIASPGLYRYHVASLTVGARTYADQGGVFTAGPLLPGTRTLRDILTAIRLDLGDGEPRTTTGNGGTTALVDSGLSGVAGEFRGSEVLILEPAVASDPNPVRVTGFDPVTGQVTFAPAVSLAVPAGTDYLLGRLGGTGYSHAQIVSTVERVLAAAELSPEVSHILRTPTISGWGAWEYALPVWLTSVHEVHRGLSDAEATGSWQVVARGPSGNPYWDVRRDTRTLVLRRPPPTGGLVRVTGSYAPAPPRHLGGLVDADADWLIEATLFRLKRNRGGQRELAQAAALFQDARLRRFGGGLPRPNEVRLG